MGLFKFANQKEVRKIFVNPEDESEGWIEVQAEFNKNDVRRMLKAAPKTPDGQTPDIDQGFDFQEKLFEMIVKGWSFTDEEGNLVPCTRESYARLDVSGMKWIDRQIDDVVAPIVGKEAVTDEEKKPSI